MHLSILAQTEGHTQEFVTGVLVQVGIVIDRQADMSIIKILLADTVSVTLILLCATVLFIMLFFKNSTKSSIYKFPPGPSPWPFIGNLNLLNFKYPQETMCKLGEQYGDVYTFHMGREKYVVLTGYEAVKEALVTQADDFGERGQTKTIKHSFNGKGIVFGVGESWKTMRRFTLSTLRDFGMGRSTIEDRIVDEAERLCEVFKQHQGKPFNPTVSINSAVSNIICILVFGDRFQYDDPQFLRLQTLVNENIRLATTPLTQLFNASIVPMFLAKRGGAQKCPTYFDEENMILSSGNLFAAGTETTSTTLRWGLLLMMKHPNIQKKVQTEIESVIGRERPPHVDDRKNMPYTDAVVHEIQRFGNVIPNNLLHETKVDTTFRGYHIPKGTPVIPLLSSVLYDKKHWETPEKFNPGTSWMQMAGSLRKRHSCPSQLVGGCV
ncbi:hypothetical protein AGOR_G00037570 [Albula goreensis]|uniref:Cytochrome P450 n=1 Tax=Albula goreensis TaxID=1534307 RepID=A0A8T3E0G9_9TELE|nr:hypothetical protein AGOR_G00037570 [Albula goreensis]